MWVKEFFSVEVVRDGGIFRGGGHAVGFSCKLRYFEGKFNVKLKRVLPIPYSKCRLDRIDYVMYAIFIGNRGLFVFVNGGLWVKG